MEFDEKTEKDGSPQWVRRQARLAEHASSDKPTDAMVTEQPMESSAVVAEKL